MRRIDVKKMALQTLERVARIEVEKEMEQRWPICFGLLHQPKRPKRN